MDKKLVGERIKKIRQKLGESQEEFGKRFNPPVSKAAVSRWEKGTAKPEDERLKAIAKRGNVSVDYLIYGTSAERFVKALKEIGLQGKVEGYTNKEGRYIKIKGNDHHTEEEIRRNKLLNSFKDEMNIFKESELNNLDLSTITLFYKLFNYIKLANNDKAMGKLRDLFFYSNGIGDGMVNYEKDESHEKIDDLLSSL
ncbi:helix-turn-helix domain-containing protein [Limosilactobacillus panis]|uniref:Helix-turn-helix transcriptional regulator n=1 Tax=Limosilactobacillus panis TaxID=47493 RepID=A0ABT7VPN1_9LACO|nr:helix-turn-helix transcriptional regulator [Limosilactobacillus panis]MDM8334695.1 helix-turn-helix transcriptional regulator [Limosilactobacillus panis]